MQDLGSFNAYDINNAGQVAGAYRTGSRHAILWTPSTITDLGTLASGAGFSVATAVNDSGQAVGESQTLPSGALHPFLYSGGKMTDLGVFASNAPGEALDINHSGDVVGWCQNTDGYYRAFLSVGGGPLQDLGTLGGNQALAKAINSSGIIVGLAETGIVIPPPAGPEYVPEGFISDNGGPMQNLNSLIDTASGWTITDATDINDLGQIVGYGTNLSGQSDYVLLTPISTPEPSALALLAAALLGLAAWSLRRPR
jgi:probable HAF family extracellular repeat protein